MSECVCKDCKSACNNKPGWFLPGEAEQAAKTKGLSLKDFFAKYLGVDWWESGDNVFVLAPATLSMDAGEEYPAEPRGVCVFFVDGKCGIHEAKPFECREYLHSEPNEVAQRRHRTVMEAWREEQHQNQIRDLLEREPYASEYESSFLNRFLRLPRSL